MNVTDLADAGVVSAYLHELGDTVALDDAEALAEDALEFSVPPAGAWTVLAHVAEHRGDYAGLERWTAAALDVDPDFAPSVADDEYLATMRNRRKAGVARRADQLLCKLDTFSGRHPQLRAQLDLAADVLGTPVPHPTIESLDVADNWQFCGFLAFEGGLLRRMADVAGALLSPGEHALLEQWRDVRHRHVRMVEQSRRRWVLADLTTGERIEAQTLIETWWEDGREGFVLVAPVGSKHAVVGEPIVFPKSYRADARAAVAALGADPRAVARTALRWRIDLERDQRFRFCFPDLEPDQVPTDEEELYELVRSRNPSGSEHDLLLASIVLHRILTRRTLETWEIARSLLSIGMAREDALQVVTERTYAEIWDRAHGEAA